MIPAPVYEFLQLDAPALATGACAATACGLLGNLLLLRKQSLLGDAISHSVLPGLVVAFVLTGARSTLPMFIGAAVAGVVTVVLISLIKRLGRIESGAAMGVVFSVMFAAGVLLISRMDTESVDLDPDCVLNGQLELILWFPPDTWSALFSLETLGEVPRETATLLGVLLVAIAVVTLFGKELRVAAFDPGLAGALGLRPGVLDFGYLVLVAMAVVASFEAVGSILVIAMLVCPAATARHLTDRYRVQMVLSGVIACVCAVGGYLLAAHAPSIFKTESSLSAAGMMSVVAGAALVMAVAFAPAHGIVARVVRRARLRIEVACEDVLGILYRAEEVGRGGEIGPADVTTALGPSRAVGRGIALAARRRLVELGDGALHLTDDGRLRASKLVRAHRLWESWLVRHLGLRADHVHDAAMRLEHITDGAMRAGLAASADSHDPHDRPIPEEEQDR